MPVLLPLTLALAFLAGPAAAAPSVEDILWGLLRQGGHVVLMRHTSTERAAGPAAGDPPGFRLEDCSTQRNLSPLGRDEARGIGAAARHHQVPVGRVLSSHWCRCLDTARLAFGRVEPWAPLDSFFGEASREPEQTREVKRLAAQPPGPDNVFLVTHQVNITALTGLAPAPGEMIILHPDGTGGFRIAGRLSLRAAEPR